MGKKFAPFFAAATTAASLAAPQLAYAESYTETIRSIATKGSDFMIQLGYGILLLVAGVAFIIIAACVLGALGSPDSEEVRRKRNTAIVVVVLCVIAAFLPTIINAITSLAGTGVNLGTVGGSSL